MPITPGVNETVLDTFDGTGTDSTSPVIAHIDTATGLTLTQDGGNVNITWNGSGIFAI